MSGMAENAEAVQAAVDAVMASRHLRSEGSQRWARQAVVVALSAAAPLMAACDPRDFGLAGEDLRSVADRLYDCADSRLDPMHDVSVRFGQIRSRLRGLADALDQEAPS